MADLSNCGVSSAHPLATDAGESVLRAGGNAADAAIAVSFALGVVEPYGSGIGGGGVAMVYGGAGSVSEPLLLDYRECAPLSGRISEHEVGAPSFVRGMQELHRRYGSMPWEHLLEPACRLAEEGFPAYPVLSLQLRNAQHLDPQKHPCFYPNGEPAEPGTWIRQPELGETLRLLQRDPDEFYRGDIAKRITEMVDGMTLEDFAAIRVIERRPVSGMFAGYKLYTSPPPLAGVTLLQALCLAERLGIHRYPDGCAEFLHLVGDILRVCYLDRGPHMGDPDFVRVPVDVLLDQRHINRLEERLRELPKAERFVPTVKDCNNTTHFVVADRSGMLLSVTNTVSDFFGSGLSVGGFFLNNQMRNFTNDPSSPNRAEPRKRPHSYIAPTMVFRGDKPAMIIGSSGGKRIPTMLTRLFVRHFLNGVSLEKAVADSRFFIDDGVVYLEEDLDEAEKRKLTAFGYKVEYHPVPLFYGGIHAIAIEGPHGMTGVADPRRGGKASVW